MTIDEHRDPTQRKLAAKRVNERIKHLASFLNGLDIGTIGAGVIIPAAKTPVELALISILWLSGGIVLHLAGQGLYAFLRSED